MMISVLDSQIEDRIRSHHILIPQLFASSRLLNTLFNILLLPFFTSLLHCDYSQVRVQPSQYHYPIITSKKCFRFVLAFPLVATVNWIFMTESCVQKFHCLQCMALDIQNSKILYIIESCISWYREQLSCILLCLQRESLQ